MGQAERRDVMHEHLQNGGYDRVRAHASKTTTARLDHLKAVSGTVFFWESLDGATFSDFQENGFYEARTTPSCFSRFARSRIR